MIHSRHINQHYITAFTFFCLALSALDFLHLPGITLYELNHYLFLPSLNISNDLFSWLPVKKSTGHMILITFSVLCCLNILAILKNHSSKLVNLLLFTVWLLLYGINYLHLEVYYHVLAILALFSLTFTDKVWSVRVALSLIYFLAAISKLTPSWIEGEIFLSLPPYHLPFFPDHPLLLKVLSLALMMIEFITPIFFLGRSTQLRNFFFSFWIVFHLYTILLLNYKFPTIMLGHLVLSFLFLETDKTYPYLLKNKLQLLIISILVIWSLTHFLIPGNKSITGEWRTAGLFMYDINSTCLLKIDINFKKEHYKITHRAGYNRGIRFHDGSTLKEDPDELTMVYKSLLSNQVQSISNKRIMRKATGEPLYHKKLIHSKSHRVKCSPYVYYRYIQQLFQTFPKELMEVQLSIQVQANGYRYWHQLVDILIRDPKEWDYQLFSHNSWINLPNNSTPKIFHTP